MPTQLISIGPPTPIIQNIVYACPVKPCTVTSTVALEKSVNGTTNWLALATGGSTTGGFVRCPTANATVTFTPGVSGGVSGNIAVDSVAIGAIPALTGAVRLSNGQFVKSRNSGNSGDVNLIAQNGTNIEVGQSGVGTYFWWDITSSGNILLNGLNSSLRLYKANPPAGSASWAYVYCKDVGGKMALMVQFPTGAAFQIAIEP